MRYLHHRFGRLTALAVLAILAAPGCDSIPFIGDSIPDAEGSLDAADIALLQERFHCTVIGLDLTDSEDGSLSTSDCLVHEGGSRIDYYGFRVGSVGAMVTINLSGAFDTQVELYDGGGNTLAVNDDISYPDNLNSRIQQQIGEGLYAIGARAAFPNLTGSYQLSLAAN